MEQVNPSNPKRRSLGTSVWYGNDGTEFGSSLTLNTYLLTALYTSANSCRTSEAKLTQPDVRT